MEGDPETEPTPDATSEPGARPARRRRGFDIDTAISTAAQETDGQVTRRVLLDAGVSSSAIDDRVEQGLLLRRHRGVYSVPGPHHEQHRRRAALLACGEGAALRGISAAVHLGLLARTETRLQIAAPKGGRGRKALDVRRLAAPGSRILVVEGLRCLDVPWILRELGPVEPQRVLEKLCDEAAFQKRFDRKEVEAMVGAMKGVDGVLQLRRLLEEHEVGTTRTLSELEERLLVLVDEQGWPRPLVNAPLMTPSGVVIRPDFRWPRLLLGVETDGRQHLDAVVAAQDAWRDEQLRLLGYRVERLTWWQVVRRPQLAIARLAPYFAAP